MGKADVFTGMSLTEKLIWLKQIKGSGGGVHYQDRTATGNPVIFTTNFAQNAKALSVDFAPKQNLNGYSKPWAGGSGENLLPFIACDNATRSGITWTKNADGSIHIKGTATASEVMSRTQNVLATDKSYLTYFDPGKYAITSFGGRLWVQFTDEEQSKQTFSGNTILDGQTAYYTFTERTAVYARISVKSSDGAVDNDVKVSVVKEWTAPTEWTPYENICPITGFDSLSVTRTNKNLYPSLEGHEETRYYGITFTYNNDGSITANGTSTGVAFSWQVMFYLKAGKYKKPVNLMVQDPNNGWANVSGGGYLSTEFTIPKEMQVVARWRIPSGVTVENEVFYPYIYPDSVTDLTYEEQIKDEYTFNLGRTVYGGTLNAKTGVITATDALIASYNGETLPSTWISDRDEYKAGVSPSTGAQVVYKLATPLTYQLTPQQIALLEGENVIATDADNLNVTYQVKV